MDTDKEHLLIVGNGVYAQMLNRYIKLTDFGIVDGYVVEKKCIDKEYIDDKKVYPLEEIGKYFSAGNIKLIMGIGYKNMGNIRKRVYEICKNKGYLFENYIHPTAIVAEDLIIGEGNNIFEGVLIQMGTKIGNCNLIYGKSVIGHDSEIGDFNSISLNVTVAGNVDIKNNCFLGAGAVTKDHITISDYALVGAGGYAFKSLEEFQVVSTPKNYIIKNKISTEYI